jgi:hypothetical protein
MSGAHSSAPKAAGAVQAMLACGAEIRLPNNAARQTCSAAF